jgi:hypothetical protein
VPVLEAREASSWRPVALSTILERAYFAVAAGKPCCRSASESGLLFALDR